MVGWQRCLVLLLLVAITYVSSVEETMVPPDARNFNSQDWLMKRYKDGVTDSQKVYEDFERQVPHYCDPPNPCPLGYDSGFKGCDSSVLDTVQFNRDFMTSQQLRRLCPCDSEHDSCKDEERSGKVHTISSAFRLNRTQSYIADQATFQDVIDNDLGELATEEDIEAARKEFEVKRKPGKRRNLRQFAHLRATRRTV